MIVISNKITQHNFRPMVNDDHIIEIINYINYNDVLFKA